MKIKEPITLCVTNKVSETPIKQFEELALSDPNWEISLEDLETFIKITKDSGYEFQTLNIIGAGEPTLWSHFSEGLTILDKSGACVKIDVFTSGDRLDKLTPYLLEELHTINFFVYQNTPKMVLTQAKALANSSNKETEHHKRLWRVRDIHYFDYINPQTLPEEYRLNLITPTEEANIPCDCLFKGPMIYKNRYFPNCNGAISPSVISNAISTPLVKGYLSFTIATQDMTACSRCKANSNLY